MRKSSKIIITLATLTIIGVPLLFLLFRAAVPGKKNDTCSLSVSTLSTVRVDNITVLKIVKGSESDRGCTMTVDYDSRLTKLSLEADNDTLNLVHLNAGSVFIPVVATLTVPSDMQSLTVLSASSNRVYRYCTIGVEGLSMSSLTIMTPDNISIASCDIDTLTALTPADYDSYHHYANVTVEDTRIEVLNIADLVKPDDSNGNDRRMNRYLVLEDNAVVDTINAL